MLSLTQPSTSGSPPASTDPLHHAVEELLVELRRDRAEVADEADGAGEVPRLAGDEIVLTQGEHPQQAVDAIEAGRLDVLLPVPANRLTALATHYTTQFHSEPLGATFGAVMNTRFALRPRSPQTPGNRQIRASGACNARSYRSGRWSSLGARSCCRIHAVPGVLSYQRAWLRLPH
jgi:hypothetical protein